MLHLAILRKRQRISPGECVMPMSKKGTKIKQAMVKKYGKKKGTQVFHASKNAGKIRGVEK